ncbi:hypothetical protein L2E82_18788 [Cichorium intybus]|uniref:Uncharacterized protein n=1 Tax=Cichorium intybus TaxID=13427 RepID=A0ACB9FAF0_CICIN|nr:hypothetical protein L2E82_18788 [Cichorium intybus]
MDQIGYSYNMSLSSSSYKQHHSRKSMKPSQPSYHNSLHSVRKPLQKPTTKQFIAPLPPTPPKIYNIDSSNFKLMVRVLTSEPEFQYPSPRRLKDIAPAPLILSTIPKPSFFDLFSKPIPPSSPPSNGTGMVSELPTFMISPDFSNLLSETFHTTRHTSKIPVKNYLSSYDPSEGALMSPLGFSMSPTSLSWCSSVFSASGPFPS